ncbi:exosome complex component RRP40-like [Symsagittifera roscoffensis]|uniref:exosome complex component RRP40-like n=1 Tax=Symsagittifera roscoffensis TaxID=84072 RepID=UPI00307BE044
MAVNEPILAGDIFGICDGDVAGPGLVAKENIFSCRKSGILRKKKNVFFVEFLQKKYSPVKGDELVGIVLGKMVDAFKIDIGCGEPAILNVLSFEGATKRSYPDLKIGDTVFCRLISSDPSYELEVVCIDGKGKADGLGPLASSQPSITVNVSCNFCRRMLLDLCPLMSGLSELYKFEVCVGHNGRIYLAASSHGTLMLVANTILTSESMDDGQIQKMLRKLGTKHFVDI